MVDSNPKAVSGLGSIAGRQFVRSLDDFIQHLPEFVQPGGRDDDGVVATGDIFGDSQQPSAGVFLEGEYKIFPLDLDFPGLQ